MVAQRPTTSGSHRSSTIAQENDARRDAMRRHLMPSCHYQPITPYLSFATERQHVMTNEEYAKAVERMPVLDSPSLPLSWKQDLVDTLGVPQACQFTSSPSSFPSGAAAPTFEAARGVRLHTVDAPRGQRAAFSASSQVGEPFDFAAAHRQELEAMRRARHEAKASSTAQQQQRPDSRYRHRDSHRSTQLHSSLLVAPLQLQQQQQHSYPIEGGNRLSSAWQNANERIELLSPGSTSRRPYRSLEEEQNALLRVTPPHKQQQQQPWTSYFDPNSNNNNNNNKDSDHPAAAAGTAHHEEPPQEALSIASYFGNGSPALHSNNKDAVTAPGVLDALLQPLAYTLLWARSCGEDTVLEKAREVVADDGTLTSSGTSGSVSPPKPHRSGADTLPSSPPVAPLLEELERDLAPLCCEVPVVWYHAPPPPPVAGALDHPSLWGKKGQRRTAEHEPVEVLAAIQILPDPQRAQRVQDVLPRRGATRSLLWPDDRHHHQHYDKRTSEAVSMVPWFVLRGSTYATSALRRYRLDTLAAVTTGPTASPLLPLFAVQPREDDEVPFPPSAAAAGQKTVVIPERAVAKAMQEAPALDESLVRWFLEQELKLQHVSESLSPAEWNAKMESLAVACVQQWQSLQGPRDGFGKRRWPQSAHSLTLWFAVEPSHEYDSTAALPHHEPSSGAANLAPPSHAERHGGRSVGAMDDADWTPLEYQSEDSGSRPPRPRSVTAAASSTSRAPLSSSAATTQLVAVDLCCHDANMQQSWGQTLRRVAQLNHRRRELEINIVRSVLALSQQQRTNAAPQQANKHLSQSGKAAPPVQQQQQDLPWVPRKLPIPRSQYFMQWADRVSYLHRAKEDNAKFLPTHKFGVTNR